MISVPALVRNHSTYRHIDYDLRGSAGSITIILFGTDYQNMLHLFLVVQAFQRTYLTRIAIYGEQISRPLSYDVRYFFIRIRIVRLYRKKKNTHSIYVR